MSPVCLYFLTLTNGTRILGSDVLGWGEVASAQPGILLYPSGQEKGHQKVGQVHSGSRSTSEFVLPLTRCVTLGKLFTPLSTVSLALKRR